MSETFGSRVKYYREIAGISQERLSEMMGYKSKNAVWNIEKDKSNLPAKKLLILADILGVSPDVLLGGKTIEEKKQEDDERKHFTHTIDLTTISDDYEERENIWHNIQCMMNAIATNGKNADYIFYDLTDYSLEQRKLIKGIIDSTISNFK